LSNQALIDLAYLRIDQFGIKLGDNIDTAAVFATLEKVFVPLIPSFLPSI
jgi:hypothetical protein